MRLRYLASVLALVIASLTMSVTPVRAQVEGRPHHETREYSAYEKLVFQNVSTFHKNFNNHDFAKNGELVADDLIVDSNGTELKGRDAFVQRIARFTKPFPDVHLEDLEIIVDGNMAAIRFIITGTQLGDLETPSGVIPATSKKIKVDGIEYFTFNKEGKLTHLVTVEDLAGMLRQLKSSN